MLKEVGFWCTKVDHTRPNPLLLVDKGWWTKCDSALFEKIEWYLTRGFIESHELAYSFCRFPRCSLALEQPRLMGACTLTDGVYCWPEGYWHYVSYHHVKPPQEFLAHLMNRYEMMAEMTRKARDDKKLLLWDDRDQKAVDMPHAMQEWITSYTTIQIHS